MSDDRERWLAEAIRSPGSVFESPEDLTVRSDLSQDEKIRILRSWEYDAADIQVATEENMDGPENDLLHRILQALATLTDGEEIGKVAPSKQHGLTD